MLLKKLKKQSALQLTALILVAAFAIVMGACAEPDPDPSEGAVNFSRLNTKITEAENLCDNTVVDTSAANVAKGTYWVTREQKDAFETAINAAKDAKNAAKNQEAVNTALADLEAAIATFNAVRTQGTKTDGFTAQQLAELIASANTAKDGVKTSTDGKDVLTTEYWVSRSEMTALETAITNATGATEANRDSLYVALNTALNSFNDEKTPGTKIPLHLTDLESAITDAEELLNDTFVDTDAANVAMGASWVTRAVYDALEGAMKTAQSVLDEVDSDTTQTAIDEAKDDLKAAIQTFNNAIKEGEKETGFTMEQLTEELNAIKADRDATKTSADGDDVSPQHTWVKSDDKGLLNNAINAAEAVTGAGDALDTAYLALIAAKRVFDGVKTHGTDTATVKGTLQNAIGDAGTAKDGVVEGADADTVELGKTWATAAQFKTLNDAIAAADEVYADEHSSKKDVEAATNTLSGAISDFNAALTGNGPGAYIENPIVDYSQTLSWGSSINPTDLGLTPGNDSTEIRLNWYAAGTTAQARFIKGTREAGTELIEVTGTGVNSREHNVTVTGLEPGASYQYSVSNNGTDWSPMYDFRVAPATGAWRFAAVADPQLTTGAGDTTRYRPNPNTTAQGWKDTMPKILAHDVYFIAGQGDQVDTSNNATQYNHLFAPPGMQSLPFAPTMGNHDTNAMFWYKFNMPNEQSTSTTTSLRGIYYYLYNNVLFVVVNTSGNSSTTNINNFRNIITAAKTAHAGKYDWLIVQHHKSTASVATHIADTDIRGWVTDGFETLMSEQNVDFVLAGHDHVYARSHPLIGKGGGLVSLPDKSQGDDTHTYTDPGNPIYLTFTTGSGLKFYQVAGDPQDGTRGGATSTTNYPYLGADANGNPTLAGGSTYNTGVMPVSNLCYVQPYIPSYTIVDVDGRTIKFSTYAIATLSGKNSSATENYSYDENVPYDWVEVTK